MGPLVRPVFDYRADSITAPARMPRVQKIHGESKVLQTVQTLFESRLARYYSTKEHVTYYNARVPFLLSLDEGTTSARSALYGEQGRRFALESTPIECRYPQPGWVEQDAEEIWRSQLDAARRTIAQAAGGPHSIAALGVTNQRETTIVWDRKTGKAVAPGIVWQCRRTADFCDKLASSAWAASIGQKTGLVIDAYFSGSKIEWILQNSPGAKRKAADGELLFGTVDTWLVWKLTNGSVHVTDLSNASRTMVRV